MPRRRWFGAIVLHGIMSSVKFRARTPNAYSAAARLIGHTTIQFLAIDLSACAAASTRGAALRGPGKLGPMAAEKPYRPLDAFVENEKRKANADGLDNPGQRLVNA